MARGGAALLRCVIAVRVPFFESIISSLTIWNRQFHGLNKNGVFCAKVQDNRFEEYP